MNENRYGTTLSPVLDEEILNNPKAATVEVCFTYFFLLGDYLYELKFIYILNIYHQSRYLLGQ